ncbi:fasciclin domain-containing protein, partial [Lasiosphaeria miniovina]
LASLAALPLSSAWQLRQVAKPQDLGTVLSSHKNISTYYGLVKQYPDILLQLPNYAGVTLVAPNNNAFTKYELWDPNNKTMVTNFLLYHIMQGTVSTAAVPQGVSTFVSSLLTDPAYTNVTGGQKVIIDKQPDNAVVFTSGIGSRATVVEPDIPFTGGLLHIVETLMVPPARLETTTRDYYKDLQSFLGALYAAGLVSEFADQSNVTILAPREDAFQRVAPALAALSKADLANVLRYHLLPGTVRPSVTFANATHLATAADGGQKISLRRAGNNLYFDRAQLLQPDILIANGVVHIIADVLNPNATSAPPDPALGTQAPAYSPALATDSALPFVTALPCTTDCPVTTTAITGSGS